jgi:hypothetical protein
MGRAARSPAPTRDGRARPAPRRRSCRSCRRAGPALSPSTRRRSRPASRPTRADHGRSGRRSSTRSPPAPAGRAGQAAAPTSAAHPRQAASHRPRSARPTRRADRNRDVCDSDPNQRATLNSGLLSVTPTGQPGACQRGRPFFIAFLTIEAHVLAGGSEESRFPRRFPWIMTLRGSL